MGEIKSGSEAAKEVGVALAVLYNHIRAGRVVNRKAGGWPLGKGIEVDMDEVRAAISAPKRTKSGAPRAPRGSKKAAHEMHEQLDAEREATNRRKAKEANARGDNPHAVRLHRYERGAVSVCPVDPSHGAMFAVERARVKGGRTLYCAHVMHDGRSTHQLGGFSPQTQNYFTPEEAQIEQPAGRLGLIMLEWIYGGRADLAEDLEVWMEAHDLTVWIPERS